MAVEALIEPAPRPYNVLFQKSEVEGCEYQDDSYIHRQPFPEMVLEEQEIYSDHNGYQEQYIKHDSRLASHFSPPFKAFRYKPGFPFLAPDSFHLRSPGRFFVRTLSRGPCDGLFASHVGPLEDF